MANCPSKLLLLLLFFSRPPVLYLRFIIIIIIIIIIIVIIILIVIVIIIIIIIRLYLYSAICITIETQFYKHYNAGLITLLYLQNVTLLTIRVTYAGNTILNTVSYRKYNYLKYVLLTLLTIQYSTSKLWVSGKIWVQFFAGPKVSFLGGYMGLVVSIFFTKLSRSLNFLQG